MKLSTLVVFFGVLSNSLFSQIKGVVLTESDEAESYVNVLLKQASDSSVMDMVLSNDNGVFVFSGVDPGTYFIEVRFLGYEAEAQSVFQYDGQAVDLAVIRLKENAIMLAEAQITARKPLFQREIDRLIVNVQENTSYAGNTVLDVVSKSPGVLVDRANNQIMMSGKNGVIIMMDGKRIRLEEGDLIGFLEGIPAANVGQLDLISIPPAEYDADGNAGIIDIKLIKSEQKGFYGNLNFFAGYGDRPKYGTSGLFNYSTSKISILADLSTNNNYSIHDVTYLSEIEFDESTISSDMYYHRPNFTSVNRAKVVLDYVLTNRTDISMQMMFNNRLWSLIGESRNLKSINEDGFTEYIDSKEDNKLWNGLFNVHAEQKLGANDRLNFDYDMIYFERNNPSEYGFTQERNGSRGATEVFTVESRTPLQIQVGRIDYSSEVNKNVSFKSGIKTTFSQFDNEVRVADIINDSPIYDARFTNDFDLQEKIHAAYVSSSWSASDHQLNERIGRPGFQMLAPSFFFFDRNMLLSGNSKLQASISRQYGLSYQWMNLLLGIQYTDTKNAITWGQPLVTREDEILIFAPLNLASRKLWNWNASWSHQVLEQWNFRAGVNMYHKEELITLRGEDQNVKVFFYDFNVNNSFTLGAGWNTDVGGTYNSSAIYGVERVPIRWALNLGVSKKFENGMNLSLSVQDLFDKGSFWQIFVDQQELGINYEWKYDLEAQVVRLQLAWPIGNTKYRSSKKYTTGSEAEQTRLN